MVQNVLDLDVQNSFLILQVEMIPATSPGSSEKGPHTSSMGPSSNQGSISSGSSEEGPHTSSMGASSNQGSISSGSSEEGPHTSSFGTASSKDPPDEKLEMDKKQCPDCHQALHKSTQK